MVLFLLIFLAQFSNHKIMPIIPMRQQTLRTIPQPLVSQRICATAVRHGIQWTKAKKAVDLDPFVTGKKFAFRMLEKFVVWTHRTHCKCIRLSSLLKDVYRQNLEWREENGELKFKNSVFSVVRNNSPLSSLHSQFSFLLATISEIIDNTPQPL